MIKKKGEQIFVLYVFPGYTFKRENDKNRKITYRGEGDGAHIGA